MTNPSDFVGRRYKPAMDAGDLLIGFDPSANDGLFVTRGDTLGSAGGAGPINAGAYDTIQQAINAANTAGGGEVWIPAGEYELTSGLVMYPNITLTGAGPNATILTFTDLADDGIYGEDWRYVTIRNLSLVGPGKASGGTASGIKAIVTGLTARNALDFVRIVNVFIDEWPVDGVNLDTPIVSHLDTVIVFRVNRHGFNIQSEQVDINGTSTTLTNCYAAGCKSAGFRFHRMSYCNIVGSAADANGISYWIYGCKGISLAAPGSETPYYQDATYNGRTVYVYGSWGIVITAGWFINNIGVCIDVAGESHVTLINPFEGSPGNTDSTNNNPTDWLRVAVDCEVTVIDEQVVTTGTDIDAGAKVMFSSLWGARDRANAWTANNEFQGTLYVPVGGTLLVEGTTDFASGLTVSAGAISTPSLSATGGIEGASLYATGALTVEGNVTFTGAQVNIPAPSAPGRAATKAYVDAVASSSKSANYTAALTDIGTAVEFTATANFTIPPNSSVAFPTGAILQCTNMGSGTTITIAAGVGVTLRSAGGLLNLATQYTSAILRKRATDEWVVEGLLT